jgi:uncharacterized protein (TIGR00369 family)
MDRSKSRSTSVDSPRSDTSSKDLSDLPLMAGNPLLEPLFDHLGIRLTRWNPGFAEFELEIERRHLNYLGSLHGGVIATLLDVACGYSGLRSISNSSADLVATVMLTISYHAGVTKGTIKASGRVTGGGRSLYFASGEIVAQDGTLIATAQGTFKLSAPRV